MFEDEKESLKKKEKKSKQIILVSYNEAPKHLQDNEYIRKGYLVNCDSMKKVTKSLFMIHNETVNVWSHLLGAILIIVLVVYTAISITNYKTHLSNIKLEAIDSEICQNLYIMFENLKYIYKKYKILKYFNKLKGNSNIEKTIKKDLWEEFYQNKLNFIKHGSNIIKINFTSNGKKEHYYKINSDKDLIEVYEKKYKNDSSSNNVIEFNKIYKIYFGIISNNLIKKNKLLSYNQKPWNYLSIIEKNKSLDWEFNKLEICKNWFYGLHNYLLK